jgi:hypothetical protein
MRNPDVDAWFEKKQPAQADRIAMQAVLIPRRDVALAADDRIEESIKWSTPTHTRTRGRNIFSFNVGRRPRTLFVSLLFHTGAKIPGEHSGLAVLREIWRDGPGDALRPTRPTSSPRPGR